MQILEIYFGPLVKSVGGAERVFCNMANELTNRGHTISAVCFEDKTGLPFYQLARGVNFYNLQNMSEQIRVPKWRKLARELLRIFGKNGFDDPYNHYRYKKAATRLLTVVKKEKPDIAVCYDINSLQLLSKMQMDKIKIVFMLHMDAVTFWRGMRSRQIAALKHVDCIQVLLPKDKEFLEQRLQVDIEIIPNVVDQVAVNENKNFQNEKIIVNIGRLDKKQKQQHLLIEAFSKIVSRFPDWQVHLYGGDFTKNYRCELSEQIKKYNLESQVKLMGVTSDSTVVLKKAEIFAFPSAFEGFGLALAEAMAVGLPCIGLKSCLAVSQLIKNDETGILADDSADGLAKALEGLMRDEDLRVRLGINAKKSMEAFAPEKIWNQWDALLNKILRRDIQI